MEEYLITYEYKTVETEVKDCIISTKTRTKIFNLNGLTQLTERNDYYDNYIKILFCQKL